MLLANTAEGGTNTTTVTAGNSGGTSGNAFDTVTGAPTFSTTQAAHGTLSYSFSTTTASTLSLNWTTSLGSNTVIAGRAYLYATSFSVGSFICRGRDGSAVQVFRIVTDTTGKITLRVGSGNTLVGTGANSMSVNTWYRIEWVINVAASAQVDVRVYLGDSATLFDSVSSASANTGTSNDVETNVGIFTSTASVPQYYLDDIVVSNASFPGPAVVSTTATSADGSGAGQDAAASVGALDGGASATGAAGDPVAAVAPAGGLAGGTGAGLDAVPALSPLAGSAGATGAALDATAAAGATATSADGSAAALDATVSVSSGGVQVSAGVATATALAYTLRLPVRRPNTGTVTRPNAGVVTRPDTGVVSRP